MLTGLDLAQPGLPCRRCRRQQPWPASAFSPWANTATRNRLAGTRRQNDRTANHLVRLLRRRCRAAPPRRSIRRTWRLRVFLDQVQGISRPGTASYGRSFVAIAARRAWTAFAMIRSPSTVMPMLTGAASDRAAQRRPDQRRSGQAILALRFLPLVRAVSVPTLSVCANISIAFSSPECTEECLSLQNRDKDTLVRGAVVMPIDGFKVHKSDVC